MERKKKKWKRKKIGEGKEKKRTLRMEEGKKEGKKKRKEEKYEKKEKI